MMNFISILDNILIILSCYVVLIGLVFLYIKKREHLPKSWMLLFISSMLLCSTTRLLDVTTSHVPVYELRIFLDFITAVTSVIMSFMIFPMVKCILSYKSAVEYECIERKLIEEADNNYQIMERIREINHELANRAQYLENTLATQGWINTSQARINDLRKIVNDLRKEYNKK